jgi:hypothetical protein
MISLTVVFPLFVLHCTFEHDYVVLANRLQLRIFTATKL